MANAVCRARKGVRSLILEPSLEVYGGIIALLFSVLVSAGLLRRGPQRLGSSERVVVPVGG